MLEEQISLMTPIGNHSLSKALWKHLVVWTQPLTHLVLFRFFLFKRGGCCDEGWMRRKWYSVYPFQACPFPVLRRYHYHSSGRELLLLCSHFHYKIALMFKGMLFCSEYKLKCENAFLKIHICLTLCIYCLLSHCHFELGWCLLY